MIELLQFPQEHCPPDLRDQILELMRMEWPGAFPEGEIPIWPDNPSTQPHSLVYVDSGTVISHLSVPRKTFSHAGESYEAFGISEVLTPMRYRRQGFGLKLIREAFRYTAEQQADLSIFTCSPSLIGFYTQGGWEPAGGLTLVGGTRQQPFRSDSLGLATMLQLLSPKAITHGDDFKSGDVRLELGDRKLW